MRSWAVFFYGVAVGFFAAWIVSVVVDSPALEWLLVGAAAVLACGLLVHQRSVTLDKGRRWRKNV